MAEFLQHYYNRKFKLVLYWHLDITKQKLLGKLFHGQTIRLLKRADRIVATSPNYIDGSPYLSAYRDKCCVIPNCIRTERLTPTDQVYSLVDEVKKKMRGRSFASELEDMSLIRDLLIWYRSAGCWTIGFIICIGGNGELTEELKREVQGDNKIEFPGRISDEKMIAYYMACDIFCFPLYYYKK